MVVSTWYLCLCAMAMRWTDLEATPSWGPYQSYQPYQSPRKRCLVFLILKTFQSLHLYHTNHGDIIPDVDPECTLQVVVFQITYFFSAWISQFSYCRSSNKIARGISKNWGENLLAYSYSYVYEYRTDKMTKRLDSNKVWFFTSKPQLAWNIVWNIVMQIILFITLG